MKEFLHDIGSIVTKQHVFNFVSATIILIVGVYLSRLTERPINRLSQLDSNQRMLFSKIARYGVITLAAAAALSQLGFDLKVVLGAAGVLTVAIGFAAQTSGSNLISGIFLMVERPFVTGDTVQVGDVTGVVMTIDLLSTKLRTPNNLMVRIPNETMVKSNIVNFTYFPIRRIEITVGVGYGSDLAQVESILREAANAHPLCLDEPEPEFLFQGFGDSSINVQLNVWTLINNVLIVKNEVYTDIKARFGTAGIEIPFPTRTILLPEATPAAEQIQA
ncbi:MAG: mechanosensitive ion channel family protein [Bdellovibrionota bacterium]